MANEVLTEKRGEGLIVTLNRPERGNALTLYIIERLFQVLKTAALDHAVRAIMLRGSGGNFMDGAEIKAYGGDAEKLSSDYAQMFPSYNSAIREIRAMNKPVLAVVEGSVAGPGLSLMLACDLVIAARNTKFNARFASYGLGPDGGITSHLVHAVGMVKAAEILLLNDTFDAVTAEQWRLINKVIEDDKLTDESLAWLDRLSTGATKALVAAKISLSKSFEQGLLPQLSLEHTNWLNCVRSFDFREAIKAQAAGKPPKFSGA